MIETYSINPAQASDISPVSVLLAGVELPTHGVEVHINNFLVARAGATVIGCIGMEIYGQSCLLRSLAVHPDHRGQGLGSRLMAESIARAREQGIKQAVVLTHTVERLAARFGFERISRSSVDPRLAGSWEFQADCCQTAVCLRLSLDRG